MVTTGSDGSYSDAYKPDGVGSWSVKALWDGDSTHEGASSSEVDFTVNTSFIGGPGWTDDMAVFGGIGIVATIGLIQIFRRKKKFISTTF
jgi:hypothetical protein